MNKIRAFSFGVLLFGIFASTIANAQMFATEVNNASAKVQADKVKDTSDWSGFYSAKQNANVGQPMKDNVPPAKQEITNPEDYIYKNVPQVDRPTLDGVKRGRTSVVPAVKNAKVNAEGYIYLFYSDFSVDNMMNGSTTCDVKFQILTTLDRKLSSLAVRLKWPSIETPLTFIDVNPNQEYHMVYTLLGDGCYSMDKIPNIIINRCRVKGMSQEECARKVRWIRKR